MKTRNQSNSEKTERRNSVSEITDYFTKMASTSTPKETNTTVATPKAKDKQDNTKQKSGSQGNKAIKQDKTNLNKGKNNPNQENASSPDNSQLSATGTIDKHVEQIGSSNETDWYEEATDEELIDQTAIIDNEETTKDATECTNKEATTQTSEDEILVAIRELQNKVVQVEEKVDHPKNGLTNQLAKNIEATKNNYSDIHGAVNGILARLATLTKKTEENSKKMEQLEKSQTRMASLLVDNKRLVNELQIMQGLVQKLSQQVDQSSGKILDLTKRGMEQNLIIHGMEDDFEEEDRRLKNPIYTARERPKHAVIHFLRTVMNLDVAVEDVWKAHRMGPYKPGKVRPMVIKAAYSLKELIMEHIGELKDKSNEKTKQKYFIAEQIPEGIVETRKQINNRVKILRDQDAGKPEDQKKKIQVLNNNIMVDGEMDKPIISPPQPAELFVDGPTQDRIDQMQAKLIETPPSTHKNSIFMAIAVKVHNLQELKDSYIAVAQRYPSADHIMLGYAFKEQTKLYAGFCDDREHGAGHRIKNTIFENHARNVAVFVLRTFGGIHMGFDRFAIITQATKNALELLPK